MKNKPSSAQIERLKYIDNLLFFQGFFARLDLINRFRISPAAATKDILRYSELAPSNLTYDVRNKHYVEGKDFKKQCYVDRNSFDRCPVYEIPRLYSFDDPEYMKKIRCISKAIQNTQVIEINYSSVSGGRSRRKVIPVALADNFIRWHLRAYDRKREKFADFVIERIFFVKILNNELIEEHERSEKDDAWHSTVILKIAPHPKNLADSQSFETGEIREVHIRSAMAGYFLRLWNVDCSPDSRLTGQEYQYKLSNLDEVSKSTDLSIAPGYTCPATSRLPG